VLSKSLIHKVLAAFVREKVPALLFSEPNSGTLVSGLEQGEGGAGLSIFSPSAGATEFRAKFGDFSMAV
jgi:hypothetical protein